MLELRPSCEHCDKELPADSTEAMICSFECTFCQACVENILQNVCPNCGGGFSARPHRPQRNLKGGNYLGSNPASTNKVYKPVDLAMHQVFAENIKNTPSHKR
ncbi:DUF1272 domain-containing protein [Aliikangiella coralliicola]|uniref:DUF1272 domain-containing protein n=1 Tax=Aliikangiella coralliicola TaxID=2592383 RepID=A0A545UBK3_9GAMM|nr:DUF1272 domain-containing protein [Aliikangiella coralliicola]TQV86850.1 DUF1272 domain-containing protein [Aliikangiella coralliicola]